MRFTTLTALLALFFVLDLVLGSVMLPINDVFTALMGKNPDVIHSEIILNYRLPKAIAAILTGAALSVAGLMMQTLFRNPLAGPDVLGVNAGAGLGVALITMISSTFIASIPGGWLQVITAIVGASLVLLLVIVISTHITNSVSLLIIGIMLGNVAGAIISVIQSISNPDAIKLFIVWTFGSLSSVTWNYLTIMTPLILMGLLIALLLYQRLNALLLGENYAKGLGVNVRHTRLLIIISTALLAGTATAFTGPIAFIGITVPHIVRGIMRTADHRILIPASILCGASLLLLCDLLAQLPGTALTLPINSICALFGAPMIVWIIFRKQ